VQRFAAAGTNMQHHCEANDLGACVEVGEGAASFLLETPYDHPACLKTVASHTTPQQSLAANIQSAIRKPTNASMATLMSSGEANSSGLWLTPSRQRTKSIAIGQRSDMADASCVAPEGKKKLGLPDRLTASASCSDNSSEQGCVRDQTI
jgi:hypothetical protein